MVWVVHGNKAHGGLTQAAVPSSVPALSASAQSAHARTEASLAPVSPTPLVPEFPGLERDRGPGDSELVKARDTGGRARNAQRECELEHVLALAAVPVRERERKHAEV